MNQSYKDIEIILIDDGSPDNCPKICDDYAAKDDRIKVVHKKNGGIVSARQAGSEQVTGEYSITVDGDDWIAPDYCEKMAEIIKEYHPDIVMCGHFNAYEDRKEERPIPYRSGFYSKQDIEKEIFPVLIQDEYAHCFRLSLWAKAINSRLQREQQLENVIVNMGEDVTCVSACIFNAGSLYIMEPCLYYYRQNQISATKGGRVYGWDGPEIRGRHLEKRIDINTGDMRQQIYRSVVHALFTVAKSQFFRQDASRKIIVRDIKDQLDRPYYREALKNARFKGMKARLMLFSLKHKQCWLLDLLK